MKNKNGFRVTYDCKEIMIVSEIDENTTLLVFKSGYELILDEKFEKVIVDVNNKRREA